MNDSQTLAVPETTIPSELMSDGQNPQVANRDQTGLVEELCQRILARYRDTSIRAATYRLQFQSAHFRFSDATSILSYLKDLGISHVYASPFLKSRHASSHGYDVVDHSRINDELGTADEFATYLSTLQECGLKQIMDVVPNHMSVGNDENAWWLDVLMNGPASPYANYFDIDWEPVKRELSGKVLLPILGDLYGSVLEAGEIQVEYREGAFWVRCHELSLPLDPQTWSVILSHDLASLASEIGEENEAILELRSILTALQYLPPRSDTERSRVAERQRERMVIQGRLRRLVSDNPAIDKHISRCLESFNGRVDQPSSFDALDRLLDDQAFRLVHWKAGSDELNYRRFFDVTELAAVCMENLEVFQATHGLVLDLLVQKHVDGFRIDHIDGLFDPMEYLWRLQWSYLRCLGQSLLRESLDDQSEQEGIKGITDVTDIWRDLEGPLFQRLRPWIGGPDPEPLLRGPISAATPSPEIVDETPYQTLSVSSSVTAPDGEKHLPAYVLVEKILGVDEPLPPDWPIAGTTGYDFLNLVSGLFVDPKGLEQITRHYGRFVETATDLREIVYESKRLILSTSMQSEVQLLAHRLDRLSHRHRRSRDYTLQALRSALREIIACFPVYRTYIRGTTVSTRDQRIIQYAVAHAIRRNPNTDRLVFQFIRDVLLLSQPEGLDEAGKLERDLFIGRFQQVTSPVMAKGVEDTAFYRYVPLTSLEEVGGEPTHAVRSIAEFHRQNRERQESWPETMLCTTTHDTKRTEDVRARLHVLTEIPSLWRSALQRWTRINRKYRQDVEGNDSPSRNDEWLFYQSLVGIWPLQTPDDESLTNIRSRLQNYLEKASHEAKLSTSWINPNPRYDSAVKEFIAKTLASTHARFLKDVDQFVQSIARVGLYTSLSQAFLKLVSPGIPDIYQGQERWDFSLVDPDNRRPVDYERSRWLLGELRAHSDNLSGLESMAQQLALHPEDERCKLFMTWITLRYRSEHPEFFTAYDYLPLEVTGERAEHVCAFAYRSRDSANPNATVVVAPRLLYRLCELSGSNQTVSGSTEVSERIWSDTEVQLGDLRPTSLTQVFTGKSYDGRKGTLRLAEITEHFPVALLHAIR